MIRALKSRSHNGRGNLTTGDAVRVIGGPKIHPPMSGVVGTIASCSALGAVVRVAGLNSLHFIPRGNLVALDKKEKV